MGWCVCFFTLEDNIGETRHALRLHIGPVWGCIKCAIVVSWHNKIKNLLIVVVHIQFRPGNILLRKLCG